MCHLFAGSVAMQQYEANENVDDTNRSADVQLDSPSKVGSSRARWNVQPGVAGVIAHPQDASQAAVSTEHAESSKVAAETRRSTRSQPVRKRKGG